MIRASLPLLASAVMMATVSCGVYEAGGQDERLRVFAAASLTETFSEIGEKFEAQHGVEVEFNFAGSSNLVSQIAQGAPAGVFASADESNMESAREIGVLTAEQFASNTLVITTPPGNPAAIESLEDMAGDDVISVVCAPQVPCGSAAKQVVEAADVELSPASEETAVTDVLGKVRSGEADAGLVYRTDARAAGADVETIEFDSAEQAVNHNLIGTLEEAPDPEMAENFVEFVLSDETRHILIDAGFTVP